MIQESNADRARLFEQAFSTKKVLPRARLANWKLNPSKARHLSFGELWTLQEYLENDVAFEHLPAWIQESGAITLDRDEKQRQRQLDEETRLTATERKVVFDALGCEAAAIAELSENPIVKDTPVLLETFDISAERFGQAEVMAVLQEKYPNAAKAIGQRLLVRDAEQRVVTEKQASEAEIREEIAEAQALLKADQQERGADVVD